VTEKELELRWELYMVQCEACRRKILVEIALVGAGHNAFVEAICGECLRRSGPDPEFERKYPEVVEDVRRWLEK